MTVFFTTRLPGLTVLSLCLLPCLISQSMGQENVRDSNLKPKLVVQITVDQLRGGVLESMADRFQGGFAYLLKRGVIFHNAHYQHATTFTAVGHATLLTGGHGAQHGMVGNSWIDRSTQKEVYCVDDPTHRLLDGQLLKTTAATSPKNLLSTTTGDELVLAGGSSSRAFSVAGKDRAAIISGGRLGRAFWYDSKSGRIVTSSFYSDNYADWEKDFISKNHAGNFQDRTWALAASPTTYRFEDDRDSELGIGGLGKTFPHELGPVAEASVPKYRSVFRFTPYLDELIADFSITLLEKESLGNSVVGATDFLAIGFSSVDYVGHAWGPLSREYEDAVLHLDKTLDRLFKAIDTHIGLDNTLIVLSSDHGASPAPEAMAKLGFPTGRINTAELMETINSGLRSQFGLADDENVVMNFRNPGLYFNPAVIKARELDPEKLATAAAGLAVTSPGVAHAFTRAQLSGESRVENRLFAMAQRAFHPGRSGDIVIIQKPFWYLYKDRDKYSGMHGSPYNYDTHVPIVFAGSSIKPRDVRREVAPRDIAPTICQILGITAPTGSIGSVLTEVFDD